MRTDEKNSHRYNYLDVTVRLKRNEKTLKICPIP